MERIRWYFPEDLEQVPGILVQRGVRPHSGGTGILRSGLSRVSGLMDTARLGLDAFSGREGMITLGAALSYRETARILAARDERFILVRSLHGAATEPLRRRISIGGSINMAPYWSDLIGPLIALEAELSLVGGPVESAPLTDYLKKRELRSGTLITAVRWTDRLWRSAYYRHTRTPTDRPAFSISVLIRTRPPGRIEEARVVLAGCTGRWLRLTAVEEKLSGLAAAPGGGDSQPRGAGPRDPIAEAAAAGRFTFPSRMGFSAEYLQACARAELVRTIRTALGTGSGGNGSGSGS